MFDPKNIENYDDALKLFDGVERWRGSKDRPWSKRTHSNKRMSQGDDGEIAFSYQGHNFATWHPDNRLTLEAFNSPMQQGVFDWLTPASLRFDLACRTGPVVLTCPTDQVKAKAHYYWARFPHYIPKPGFEWDQYGRAPYNGRMANPDVKVFSADKPVDYVLDGESKAWRPVDENELAPFEWVEIDKPRARKLAADRKLPDFEAYLRAMSVLAADQIAPFEDYMDDADLMQLIADGQFEQALRHFPRGDGWLHKYRHNQSAWQQQRINNAKSAPPTWSYFGRLRTALYKEHNALIERSERVLTYSEYKRVQGLLYRFS